jgi:hypothetical protein
LTISSSKEDHESDEDNEEIKGNVNAEERTQSDEQGTDKILNETDKILNDVENSEDTNPDSMDNTIYTNPNAKDRGDSTDPDGIDGAESTCSSSSESFRSCNPSTPETTASESSVYNERVLKITTNSIGTVDVEEIQNSLNAQISSPIVLTLRTNQGSVENAEICRSTDEFPFLMGGSTVCEYIGNNYQEVVPKNSPNTGVLRVQASDSSDDGLGK